MLLRSDDAAPELLLDEPLELSPTGIVVRRNEAPPTPEEIEETQRVLPIVSIGHPLFWHLRDVVSADSSAELRVLLDREEMYLLRFYCSFRPRHNDVVIASAEFTAAFRSDLPSAPPIVYDLDPRDVNSELKRTRHVVLGPTAKFSEIEVGLGEAKFGLEYTQLVPIITAGGDGESTAYWEYSATQTTTITGGKWMHTVVRAPRATSHGMVRLGLTAEVRRQGRFFSALLRRTTPAGAAPLDTPLW